MSAECFLLFLSSPRVIPFDRFPFVLVSSIVDRTPKIETVPRSIPRSPSLGNVPFTHMEDVFSELLCVSFP